MSRIGPFEIEGNVTVLPHAVLRARERWPADFSGLNDSAAASRLAQRVRESIERGLVYTAKPRAFRLFNDDGRLPPWQRFVLSRHGTHGVVVALDFPPDVTVVTCLVAAPKIRRS